MQAVKKLLGNGGDDGTTSTGGSDSNFTGGSDADGMEGDGDVVRLGNFVDADAEAL